MWNTRKFISASILICAAFITCAGASGEEVRKQVDFSYRQFAANPDGTCSPPAPPSAHSAFPGIILAWIAGKIVSSVGESAANEVKKYTNERESNPQYNDFYDGTLWVRSSSPDLKGQLSCWEILERECSKSDDPCSESITPRLAIVGVYFRDASSFRVIPTNASIIGLAAKVDRSAKKASIAVSQTMTAIWVDGDRGRKETIYSEVIFKKKFAYSDQRTELLKFPGADFPETVLAAEPLPLPPFTPHRPAYVGVKFRVAEANSAPKLVTWIAQFFADKHDDLSTALAAALDDLSA